MRVRLIAYEVPIVPCQSFLTYIHTEIRCDQTDYWTSRNGAKKARSKNKHLDKRYGYTKQIAMDLGVTRLTEMEWNRLYKREITPQFSKYHPILNNCRHHSAACLQLLNPTLGREGIQYLTGLNRKFDNVIVFINGFNWLLRFIGSAFDIVDKILGVLGVIKAVLAPTVRFFTRSLLVAWTVTLFNFESIGIYIQSQFEIIHKKIMQIKIGTMTGQVKIGTNLDAIMETDFIPTETTESPVNPMTFKIQYWLLIAFSVLLLGAVICKSFVFILYIF